MTSLIYVFSGTLRLRKQFRLVRVYIFVMFSAGKKRFARSKLRFQHYEIYSREKRSKNSFKKLGFCLSSWRKIGFRVLCVSLGVFFSTEEIDKISSRVSFAWLRNLFEV